MNHHHWKTFLWDSICNRTNNVCCPQIIYLNCALTVVNWGTKLIGVMALKKYSLNIHEFSPVMVSTIVTKKFILTNIPCFGTYYYYYYYYYYYHPYQHLFLKKLDKEKKKGIFWWLVPTYCFPPMLRGLKIYKTYGRKWGL